MKILSLENFGLEALLQEILVWRVTGINGSGERVPQGDENKELVMDSITHSMTVYWLVCKGREGC